MNTKKYFPVLLAGIIATSGLTAATPSLASDQQQRATPRCHLTASEPTTDGRYIYATGGRKGCGNRLEWVTVSLWRDINNLPDSLAERRQINGPRNGTWQISAKCHSADDKWPYYTIVRSAKGYTVQSAHPVLC
ncbi:hypothetical protein [Actinopolyspora saharensis]|uniref:Peptidase inhibitor family I36 n=1 Tax=Actinopolyspora saharensis TaxID=995062 RepID=A0A1H0YPL8_9ACTN|nr:hypothetical protein [Actinopolyspora saharensis]SDQ17103.1 hypothetical protein SAMN04489718_0597 [Actinopolyspora saharensis]